jgi:hypothetical protein
MVDTTVVNVSDTSRLIYQKAFDRYVHEESRAVLMSHLGVFSQDLINSLSEGIEEILISAGERKPVIKRIFSILIEGLQNIRIHGGTDANHVQQGILIVAKNEHSHKIFFGNLITTSTKDLMADRLRRLNLLSDDDLKTRYMEVLSNGILSNKGGAGLGFITMRMKSKSQLAYEFHPVSADMSMFTVEMTIQKEA